MRTVILRIIALTLVIQLGCAQTPGTVRVNPTEGLEYLWIPAGSFSMGSDPGDGCKENEAPKHRVTISQGFWLGRTEVTVGAYKRFVSATGHSLPSETGFKNERMVVPNFNPGWQHDNHPMVNVSWGDAKAYCEWSGGRLPTEAEWEHAARGGKEGLKFPWGNRLTHDEANYGKDDESGGHAEGRDQWRYTAPVASFLPNSFGLYDMAGNVHEWLADWYDEKYYAKSPLRDPTGPLAGELKVNRGGSWVCDPGDLRLCYRGRLDPNRATNTLGIRCLREAL